MMFTKLIIVLFFLFQINVFAQNLDHILNSMIKAYGGETALKKVESYEQKWKVLALQKKIKAEDIRKVILPHTLEVTIKYPNKEEKRVLSPNNKYKEYNGKKEYIKGIKLKAMELQLKRLYTPLILKELKEYLKVEDYDTHYALVLSKDDDQSIYFIEKSTFIITQVTNIIYGKHKVIFNTLYTKFKKYNGVYFPTKEYKSTNNIKTAISELNEMIIR